MLCESQARNGIRLRAHMNPLFQIPSFRLAQDEQSPCAPQEGLVELPILFSRIFKVPAIIHFKIRVSLLCSLLILLPPTVPGVYSGDHHLSYWLYYSPLKLHCETSNTGINLG